MWNRQRKYLGWNSSSNTHDCFWLALRRHFPLSIERKLNDVLPATQIRSWPSLWSRVKNVFALVFWLIQSVAQVTVTELSFHRMLLWKNETMQQSAPLTVFSPATTRSEDRLVKALVLVSKVFCGWLPWIPSLSGGIVGVVIIVTLAIWRIDKAVLFSHLLHDCARVSL